jgi:hypothetical protein
MERRLFYVSSLTKEIHVRRVAFEERLRVGRITMAATRRGTSLVRLCASQTKGNPGPRENGIR